jgi:hypothetical protein
VSEISNFVVMERNGATIGCAALQLFEEESTAEVYAFAIAPGYSPLSPWNHSPSFLPALGDRERVKG